MKQKVGEIHSSILLSRRATDGNHKQHGRLYKMHTPNKKKKKASSRGLICKKRVRCHMVKNNKQRGQKRDEGGGGERRGGRVDKERKCKMIGIRDKRERIQRPGRVLLTFLRAVSKRLVICWQCWCHDLSNEQCQIKKGGQRR